MRYLQFLGSAGSTLLSTCFLAFAAAAAVSQSPPSAPASTATGDPGGRQIYHKQLMSQDRVLFQDRDLDGNMWAVGRNWKAGFDASGFRFVPCFGPDAPRNFPVRFALEQVTVGGEPLPLRAGVPTRDGTSVRTDHGSVVEIVDTALTQVEQSFVFSSLPDRGAVKIAIGVESELGCKATAEGLTFANGFGEVSYRKALAVDAAGRRLELPIEWTGSTIRMEIPAAFVAAAQLPLVLDPVIGANINVSVNYYPLQDEPDVATITSVDATCITWWRVFSGQDKDCYAQLFDRALNPISAVLAVDASTLDVQSLSIGGLDNAQNFLIAIEMRVQLTHFIVGCLVQANGVVGSLFNIERNGVVGLPGNNYKPSVGGDRYPGPAAYYAVVFEKLDPAVGNRDIYVKLVTRTGTLQTTNPIVVANTPQNESVPSISRCNGISSSAAYWMVAYQQTDPNNPADEDLYGKYVYYNGTVQPQTLLLGTAPGPETNPAASSPIDINGQRFWLCAHEAGAVGSRDIYVKVYDTNGFTGAVLNLDLAEGVLAYDRFAPHVDSDGVRFVVAYTEFRNGTSGDRDTRATTIAYIPSTNSLRLEESRVLLGGTTGQEVGPRVCSRASGGGPAGEYVIADAWSDPGVLTSLELYRFGGYRPTQDFQTVPAGCGSLSITASGNPVLGGSVSFTVANGAASGTLFGFPGTLSLLPIGCNCTIAVDSPNAMGNPLVVGIPVDPVFAGITLAVQGWTIVGSNCLGSLDFSNAIDFTIR